MGKGSAWLLLSGAAGGRVRGTVVGGAILIGVKIDGAGFGEGAAELVLPFGPAHNCRVQGGVQITSLPENCVPSILK